MAANTVLIVEDNPLNLIMEKKLLQRANFQVLEAEDADAGILLARQYLPDVILMDMHLPLKDAYEATRAIKADPATRDILILAVTALVMEEEQTKALSYGCSGVISKPIDVERFADTVKSYLERKKNADVTGNVELSRKEAPLLPPSAPQSTEPPDLERFFFHASHDLQAPLRKIQQFGELLKRSAQSKLAREEMDFLAGIERATNQMSGLLSDLLTWSRLSRQAGAFEEVHLQTALKRVLQTPEIAVFSHSVQIDIKEAITLEANPQGLHQLLHELIENALTFHKPDMPPSVHIRASVDQQVGCLINIQDHGIGFKPEHRERIFQPFERLHGVSQYPGTGMGLAIARLIAERHGGMIDVNSVPGEGSTFTVVLPLRQRD